LIDESTGGCVLAVVLLSTLEHEQCVS